MSYFETRSFKNLVFDYKHSPPIAVIVGNTKDACFLQLVKEEHWGNVAAKANIDPAYHSLILPVLYPDNLNDEIESVRNINIQRLHSTTLELGYYLGQRLNNRYVNIKEIRAIVEQYLEKGLDALEWKFTWLDIIAWSAGYAPFQKNAYHAFAETLNGQFHVYSRVIAVFDIEDMKHRNQESAMYALLQDLPEVLREYYPNKPIGIIVFVDEDLVAKAIKQNHLQFLNRWHKYRI